MKQRIAIILISAAVVGGGTAVSFGSQSAGRAGQKKAAPTPPLLDVVQGLYINQLQQILELTDDQFLKVAGLVKDYLRARYELEVPSRNRALNQLRQALNRGASDEELTPLTQEFDRIEGDLGSARQKFFSSADPLLQVRQRARLRLYMVQKDNQILKLIQASQNPAAVQKPLPNQ